MQIQPYTDKTGPSSLTFLE